MTESIQHKLDRVRPPRVQITYDVEIGDAIEMRELPYIVGVMADLSAKSEVPRVPMKKRKFVFVDRDNINDFMTELSPRIEASVENKLQNDGSKLKVDLTFKNMEDFAPDKVVERIEPLRKLFEARQALNDMIPKLDGNDQLEDILQSVLGDTAKLKELQEATAKKDDASADAAPDAEA